MPRLNDEQLQALLSQSKANGIILLTFDDHEMHVNSAATSEKGEKLMMDVGHAVSKAVVASLHRKQSPIKLPGVDF